MIKFIKSLFVKVDSSSDLCPKGIKSTYGVKSDFNETFQHIFKQARKS